MGQKRNKLTVEEAVDFVRERMNLFFELKKRLWGLWYKRKTLNLPADIGDKYDVISSAHILLPSKEGLFSELRHNNSTAWPIVSKSIEKISHMREILEDLLKDSRISFLHKELNEINELWKKTYEGLDAFPFVLGKRCSENVRINLAKSANLSLVIGAPKDLDVPSGYDLEGFAPLIEVCVLEGVSWKEVENRVRNNAVAALTQVLSSKVIEGYLGSAFRTNVIIYVFYSVQQDRRVLGFVARIKKFFGSGEKIEESYFVSTPKDIRFSIPAISLLYDSPVSLADTFMHEITHSLDAGLDWETRDRLLGSVREEGIARFAEVVNNPEILYSLWNSGTMDLSIRKSVPISSMASFKEVLSDADNVYTLGLGMVMQYFLATIGESNKFGNIDAMRNLLKERRENAVGLLNVLKKMSSEKFFVDYFKKVKRPFFKKELEEQLLKITDSD